MRRALTLSFVVFTLVVVGDVAFAKLSRPTLVFSHEEHMDRVRDPRCTDCHEAVRVVSGPPAIRADVCFSCHDSIPRYTPRQREAPLAVSFPHVPHAKSVACTDCHVARATTSDDERVAERALYARPSTSASCFSCHRSRGQGAREPECAACHGRDEQRVKPVSHDGGWIDRHGRSAFLSSTHAHGESCTSCHREVGCKQCHETRSPRDHTGLWRVRTHGAAAGWDRDRCKTCHETNQCIACHTTVPPPSHSGAWIARHGLMARSRTDESCLTCHQQASCNACHAGGR